jgi:phage-related protein/ribosome-binding protein aMBF1 (putative translation factor)
VAATQAVFYRDVDGVEPVDEFIETLPAKRSAKIDEYIDEHLNGRPPNEPPPEYPVSSQIDGELRELRVRFANTRYRILYQRSDNLIVLLHVIEKDTGAIPRSDIQLAKRRMTDLQGRMDATRRTPPRAAGNDAPPRAGPAVDVLIDIDKLRTMTAKSKAQPSPAGRPATTAARARAGRSEEYREARDEYAAIRALRQRNWIAAHIRERRYELDLTQQEVAERAGTSHSFISKLEGGDHIPTIPVLKRILSVLDEELLIGIERRGDNSETEREIAPVPELASG